MNSLYWALHPLAYTFRRKEPIIYTFIMAKIFLVLALIALAVSVNADDKKKKDKKEKVDTKLFGGSLSNIHGAISGGNFGQGTHGGQGGFGSGGGQGGRPFGSGSGRPNRPGSGKPFGSGSGRPNRPGSGFGSGFGRPNRPTGKPSSGCRYWCKTPTNQFYCCEGDNEPSGPVGTKRGFCPPVRPDCPGTKLFGAPQKCSNDYACANQDKCCPDTCIGFNVCKAPCRYSGGVGCQSFSGSGSQVGQGGGQFGQGGGQFGQGGGQFGQGGGQFGQGGGQFGQGGGQFGQGGGQFGQGGGQYGQESLHNLGGFARKKTKKD